MNFIVLSRFGQLKLVGVENSVSTTEKVNRPRDHKTINPFPRNHEKETIVSHVEAPLSEIRFKQMPGTL